MRKLKIISIFLVIVLLLTTGCVKKKLSNTSVRNYLVYNMERLPKDLLMLDNNNIREQDLPLLLFEGLVDTDAEGEITPAIADSWTVSEDKLTYSFHIRENAAWSDGNNIISTDFVDFFSRILKEENNIYNNQLECIFGVKDYIDNKIDFNGVAVVAKDDKNLEIRLNYPCNYFLDIISQPVFALKKNFYNLRNWQDEYKKITYTGAFIIEDIYGNGEVSLKKNNKYWNEENILSNKLHITNEETSAFALAKYKSGEIDAFLGLPTSEIESFDTGEKLVKGPIAQGIGLNFNLNKEGIIRNVRFRELISMGINKAVLEEELNGVVKKSSSYVPKNIRGASQSEYNIAKATSKEEIKQQLSGTYKGEAINIVYLNTDDNNKKIVDYIAKDLKGISLNVKSQGYNKEELDNVIDKGEYDILLSNYIGEYDSPLSFLEQWISSSKKNIYGYNNIEFDQLVLRGKVLSDVNEAQKSFEQAEKILLEDRAFIPIGLYNIIVCKKPYISGIEVNKRGNVILKRINSSIQQENTP
jgi:peptide/nickel transport system substrate-binding protein